MKPSRLITALGGVLTIVSAWMPWVSVMGISMNGFRGEMGGNPGLFFVVLGALSLVFGLIGKMWSYIIAMLCGLATAGLGFKYFNDAKSLGADVGTGIWLMIAGGVLVIIGCIMGFAKK